MSRFTPTLLIETFNKMSKVFITFGGGGQNFLDAVRRLTTQAAELRIFDRVIGFTDPDLKADQEFWTKHGTFIEQNKRGYGYWIWKSYLIEKTMKTLADGDILLYLDAGCEFAPECRYEMKRLIQVVKIENIVGTYTASREGDWTKMDLMHEMNMTAESNTLQRQAGALLFAINKETRSLVSEWYRLASIYHFIDDTPSNLDNLPTFREHRHDQSIFSLLTKKYKMFAKKDRIDNRAILYIRNRSGILSSK